MINCIPTFNGILEESKVTMESPVDISETTLTFPNVDVLGKVVGVVIEGTFVLLLNVVEIKVEIGELLVKFLVETILLGVTSREDMVVKMAGISLKEDHKLRVGLVVI